MRDVGDLAATGNADVTVDDDGRLHVAKLMAIPEPPSLVDLRKRTAAILPRVDLPELILEVMGWVPDLEAAFTSVSGGVSRLHDLNISIDACLTGAALNIGFSPVVNKGVEALERGRLSHVVSSPVRVRA